MAFNSDEKIMLYLEKCLKGFKLDELEELVPECFDLTFQEVSEGIKSRKLSMSKQNVVGLLLFHVKKNKCSNADILDIAFNMELEYTVRYNKRFEWVAHKFIGSSSKEEISELSTDLRRAIRNDNKDAVVLTQQKDGLFWISIIMKNLKDIGIYKKPFYIALSESGKYFFIRKAPHDEILEALGATLGYEKFKRIKLSGRDVRSLLKLLDKRENVDMSKRPVYRGAEAVENEFGIDMSNKKGYEDFYMECVDNDEDAFLQVYKITADGTWLGPGLPRLRNMQFKSSLTLSGNAGRIMKALPVAGILKPPFPNYFVNFSVEGKNSVRHRPNPIEIE